MPFFGWISTGSLRRHDIIRKRAQCALLACSAMKFVPYKHPHVCGSKNHSKMGRTSAPFVSGRRWHAPQSKQAINELHVYFWYLFWIKTEWGFPIHLPTVVRSEHISPESSRWFNLTASMFFKTCLFHSFGWILNWNVSVVWVNGNVYSCAHLVRLVMVSGWVGMCKFIEWANVSITLTYPLHGVLHRHH